MRVNDYVEATEAGVTEESVDYADDDATDTAEDTLF